MSLTLSIPKVTDKAQQWVKHKSGAEFLINGIGNKAYNIAIEQIGIKARSINLNDIQDTDESPTDMTLDAAGRYLIADWRNIMMGEANKEQTVEFTKENGAIALKNSIDLWSFVMENARRIQLEAETFKEDLMGKSEPQSTGVAQKPRRSKTQSTKR